MTAKDGIRTAPKASAPDAPAGDLPPLPEGFRQLDFGPHSSGEVAAMMRAYVLADRAARVGEDFDAYAKRAGLVLTPAKDLEGEHGEYPATYWPSTTEAAWRAWANKPAAVAPAGHADDPQLHHPDDSAVDRFATALKAKMAAARAKGRNGWDNEALCPAERLQSMLRDHIAKGDPVDVGNFAMMLFNRGEQTAAGHAEPVAWSYEYRMPTGWVKAVSFNAPSSDYARCLVPLDAAPVAAEPARARFHYLYDLKDPRRQYEVVGYPIGAGTSQGQRIVVYQDTESRQLFFRSVADFETRMTRIPPGAVS